MRLNQYIYVYNSCLYRWPTRLPHQQRLLVMNDQPKVLPGSSKLPTSNLPYLRGWGWNGDREQD